MMKTVSLRSQSGFTLIEVMISGLIIVAALLAISGLQNASSNFENESYQRARAMLLVEDMISRLNANRANAADYVTGTTSYWGTGDSQPANCVGSGVALDQCEWSNLLKGNLVTADGESVPGLRNAIGCIVQSATPNEYFVVIAWQSTKKPGALKPSTCGSGIYSDDDTRRVLVRGMRVATLSNLS